MIIEDENNDENNKTKTNTTDPIVIESSLEDKE